MSAVVSDGGNVWIDRVIEKAAGPLDHREALALGCIARTRVREPAHRRAHVALELGLTSSIAPAHQAARSLWLAGRPAA